MAGAWCCPMVPSWSAHDPEPSLVAVALRLRERAIAPKQLLRSSDLRHFLRRSTKHPMESLADAAAVLSATDSSRPSRASHQCRLCRGAKT
jgi:hypothetical protein